MAYYNRSAKMIMIWLDDDITRSEYRQKILDDCGFYFDDYNPCLFNDSDHCLDFITDLSETHEVLLLITSRQLIEGVIPLILEIPQIKRIYQFCFNDLKSSSSSVLNDQTFSRKLSKVGGIPDLLMLFMYGVPADFSFLKDNNLPFEMKFILLQGITGNTKPSKNHYHDIPFVYMRIFYRLLLSHHQTDARCDMLNYLRQRFKENSSQLDTIDKFDQTFPSTSTAIKWYKRNTFHHEIVNTALFEQDRMVLYRMRFFIRHLDQELTNLHNQQQMAKKYFDSFLSTSRDPNVAHLFAESASQSEQYEAVLMKVTIPPLPTDTGVFRCPFADMVRPGDEEDEAEVLFSTGALFRMEKIDINYKGPTFCTVTVTLTHDLDFDDDYTKDLIIFLRRKYDKIPFTLLAFSHLMLEMGDYDRAEEFIYQLIQQSMTTSHLFGPALSLLGQSCTKQEDYVRAFCALGIALEYLLPDNQCYLSDTWAALGQVHSGRNDFDRALFYTRKALESADTPEQIILQCIEFSIIHRERTKWDEAKSYLDRAYDQLQTYLPGYHPLWIQYYTEKGRIKLVRGKVVEATLLFLMVMRHPALILPSQQLAIISMTQQLATFQDKMGNSNIAKMLCSAGMLIAMDLPNIIK